MNETYPALPLRLPEAWRALFALCIGFFMILLDQTIVAVATPGFERDLGADYSQLLWVTSIYLLTFAVPLLVTGRLGDRFGPKNLYVAGMVIFTLSSLACGLAGSIEVLIAARAVQGIGGALLTPQTMSVINRVFPHDKRGSALGIWGAVAGISTLAGPLLGGLIMDFATWHWVFFINVPIGVVCVVLVWWWVPRFQPHRQRIDGLSVVISMVAMALIVYAIQEGEKAHWSAAIWAMLLAGVVLIGIFLWLQARVERRGKTAPLIPLGLFQRRDFAFGNLAIFAMGFAVAGMMVPVMLYLQNIHGLSPLQAGLFVTPMSLISGVLAPFVGRAVDKRSPRPMAMLGFSLMALSTLGLVVFMRPEFPLWAPLCAFLLMGFAHGFVWAPNSTVTLRDLPHDSIGAGSGMYNTTRQMGAVIGSAMIAAVLQARGETSGASAFAESLLPAAVVLVLGIVASALAVGSKTDQSESLSTSN